MKSMRRNITALLATALLVSLTTFSAKALDINNEMFSGTVNTTVSSGLSVRASERNCMLQAGEFYNAASGDHVLNATGLGGAALKATGYGVDASMFLSGGTKNYEYSGVCSKRLADAYGNTSTNPLDLGTQNADDGNLNYKDGEIIDATNKIFTEIDGTLPSGVGITLSLIGNYNPVNDFAGANFVALSDAAQDELESDVTLLNAYITTGFDAGAAGYMDVTAGRYITSWGEATFIPVGANGLVTNALDLTALRAPGASIRDALLPTEQITLNGAISDNLGFEVYYQFSNDSVEVDPKGSFFGSDVVGTGGDRILASGGFKNEAQGPDYCTYTYNVLGGNACDADSKAYHLAEATRGNNDTEAILQRAYQNATLTDWATWSGVAAAGDHGQLLAGELGLNVNNTLEEFVTTGAGLAGLNTIYTDNVAAAAFDNAASVQLMVNEAKFVDSKDDGQFGIRLNTYLEDVGTGVDVNFYYANYHSKVPYLQIVGEGGVLAGDIMGSYNYALADMQGGILADGADAAGFMTAEDGASASQLLMQQALLEGGYSSGLCAGLGASLGAAAMAPDGTASFEQKEAYKNITHRVVIEGELVHDPSTCSVYGESISTIIGVTPAIAGAVFPLNQATYRFIYPEDNEIFGLSFNTNVGGTVLQGELSYRPDFPLATNGGDQINQIADAAGVSAALTAFAHDTYGLTPANATAGVVMPNMVDTVLGTGTFESLLKNVRRSSLPFITDTGGATADYYSTAFVNYDVMSLDIGTTTSFSASHPVTQSLGADSAVLLTELAMVEIDGMDNMTNGFVARGGAGFNEGAGEHLCLGIFQGLTGAQLSALNSVIAASAGSGLGEDWQIDYDLSTGAGVSNVGAGIVDAVFGNGSYCEGQMGADERSFSYRIVGFATYNNFVNSPWSVTPNFAWSSDPSGYGPASLGGFSEGRSSLSVGVSAQNGDVSTSLSYVDQLGDDMDNLRNDMDFVSASLSYSF